ncbi:helix-turn-helix domain-containing protein [Pseudonocardia parietis]|uniref:Transcriptional regulator with XRE-family HTH domain n=1 Tax=Pseudonocardia parietis TaxID=570936 RepID=A0ABS4VKQ1_9PSEU|nr:helix-turn-helix transcriptional regulator [Pseudonocardia parietis]MBP2364457.1 transcriptional regulator with XRE-family HTH domain [Pseudonocardia parietis]
MEQEPVGARRRLGTELRRLRGNAGMKLEDVARALACSTSKVSRLENGKGVPRVADVDALLHLYGGVADVEADMLRRLVTQSRTRGWWEPFTEGLRTDRYALPAPGRYAAVESDAVGTDAFDLSVLHGLLQTAGYTRAVLRARLPGHEAWEIDQLVHLRRRRQEWLTATPPLRFRSVIDEAVLARVTGGPDVMAEQLDRLIELSRLPNVILLVLPFSAGVQRAHTGRFAVLQIPDELGSDVVHTEGHAGESFLDSPKDLETYRRVLADVRADALEPEASRRLIASYRDRHRAAVDDTA